MSKSVHHDHLSCTHNHSTGCHSSVLYHDVKVTELLAYEAVTFDFLYPKREPYDASEQKDHQEDAMVNLSLTHGRWCQLITLHLLAKFL